MLTGVWKWWITTGQSLSPSLRQEAAGLRWWTICRRQMPLLYHSTGTPNTTFHPPLHYTIVFVVYLNPCFLFLRCNIAVILLTDLIVDHGVKVEWSAYLHLLLHAIFIGNSLPNCYNRTVCNVGLSLIDHQSIFIMAPPAEVTLSNLSSSFGFFFRVWSPAPRGLRALQTSTASPTCGPGSK